MFSHFLIQLSMSTNFFRLLIEFVFYHWKLHTLGYASLCYLSSLHNQVLNIWWKCLLFCFRPRVWPRIFLRYFWWIFVFSWWYWWWWGRFFFRRRGLGATAACDWGRCSLFYLLVCYLLASNLLFIVSCFNCLFLLWLFGGWPILLLWWRFFWWRLFRWRLSLFDSLSFRFILRLSGWYLLYGNSWLCLSNLLLFRLSSA